jgi:hypothetical protein
VLGNAPPSMDGWMRVVSISETSSMRDGNRQSV